MTMNTVGLGHQLEEYLDHSDNVQGLIDILNSHGGNVWVDVMTDTDRTVLMSAAKRGRYEVCRYTLQRDIRSINRQNKRGYTALHYAVFNGHYHVAQLLCGHGADMHCKNRYQESSYDAACSAGHYTLAFSMISDHLFPAPSLPSEGEYILPFKNSTCSVSGSSQSVRKANMQQWLDCDSISTFTPTYDDRGQHSLGNSFSDYSGLFHPLISRRNVSVLSAKIHDENKSVDPVSGPETFTNTVGFLTSTEELSEYSIRVVGVVNGGTARVGTEFNCFDFSPTSASNIVTIGRSRQCTVCLADISLSKIHAQIEHIPDTGLCIRDLGSKHGTYVNATKLCVPGSIEGKDTDGVCSKYSCVVRSPDDTIQVGRVALQIHKRNVADETSDKELNLRKEMGRKLYDATRRAHELESALSRSNRPKKASIPKLYPPLAHLIPTASTYSGNSNASESINIDSETFVGRSLLKKMGWKDGVKLGRLGGEANGPVEVKQKKNRYGIGTEEFPDTHYDAKNESRKSHAYKMTQMRFNALG